MRILGGLRYRYKIVLYASIFLFSCALSSAQESQTIKSYEGLIRSSLEQSLEYQKIKIQLDVDTINADSLMTMYNWTLSGGINKVNAEQPATNPFSPNKRTSSTYNFKIKKNTASGLSPFVEIKSVDKNLSFPNATSVEFQTSSVEIGLRADLIKAFLFKNSSQVLSEVSSRKEIAKLAQQNAKNIFIKKVTQSFFKALKTFKRTQILETQCKEYSRLQKISSGRFKKSLIREKDFLTIEVLHQNCLLDKKTAENNHSMDALMLLKVTGLEANVKIDFKSFSFPGLPIKRSGFKKTNNLNYKLTAKMLKAMEERAKSKKSALFPEINLDYSLKSEARGEGIEKSLSEAAKFELKTHNVGLNLKYQFGQSAKKFEAQKSSAEAQIRSFEFENLKKSLDRDFTSLSKSVFYLNEALSNSRALVKLQDRKAKLFRKDFRNGKGGIRDLVEAQIAYLGSLEKSLDFQYNLINSQIDLMHLEGRGLDQID